MPRRSVLFRGLKRALKRKGLGEAHDVGRNVFAGGISGDAVLKQRRYQRIPNEVWLIAGEILSEGFEVAEPQTVPYPQALSLSSACSERHSTAEMSL
jgi:hypothetical protein